MMCNLCLFCGNMCRNKFCSNSCGSKYFYQERNRIIINDEMHDVIEGTLFSDAGLELDRKNRNINPRYYFKQTSRREEYVKFVASYFNLQNNLKFFNNKSRLCTNTDLMDCRFKTSSSISLLPYYNRWYPNGKKIIPKDIVITPKFLLHVYLGDGFVYKGTSYYGKYNCWYPTICTNSFEIDDILEIFIPKLKEIGIKAGLRKKCDNGKIYPLTYISRYSYNDFFNFIGPSPVKCLEYRWANFKYN